MTKNNHCKCIFIATPTKTSAANYDYFKDFSSLILCNEKLNWDIK